MSFCYMKAMKNSDPSHPYINKVTLNGCVCEEILLSKFIPMLIKLGVVKKERKNRNKKNKRSGKS